MVHFLKRERTQAIETIGPIAIQERPEIARLIGCIVAAWSYVDLERGISFGNLLGTGQESAIAIYSQIKSEGAQEAALNAAAETALSGIDLRLFKAILRLAKNAGKDRHRVAHNLWGYSPQLPEKALMIPLDHAFAVHREDIRWTAQILSGLGLRAPVRRVPLLPVPKLDRNSILVYSISDLNQMYDRIVNSVRMFVWFWQMRYAPKRKRAAQRRRLSLEPDLRKELQRAREAERKSRKTRKRRRSAEHAAKAGMSRER